MILKLILAFCAFAILSSCDRAAREQVQLSLRIESKTSGVQALSSFPVDSKLCFAVNVTGRDIPMKKSLCRPDAGVLAGFVSDGEEIKMTVNRGSDRTVDIYLYLSEIGSSCPDVSNDSSSNFSQSKFFKVGSVTGIDMTQKEVFVDVLTSFPGVANTVASQLNFPASCSTVTAPALAFLSNGKTSVSKTKLVSGTGISAEVQVGQNETHSILTGPSGVKIYVE